MVNMSGDHDHVVFGAHSNLNFYALMSYLCWASGVTNNPVLPSPFTLYQQSIILTFYRLLKTKDFSTAFIYSVFYPSKHS